MRFKRGNRTTFIVAAVIVVLLMVLSVSFGWTSFRSATRLGYVGNETRTNWSGRYRSLHGMMRKNMAAESEALRIEVVTESGTLSVQVLDSEEQVLLEQENVGTDTLQVPVDGKITVILEADHHRGSFFITTEP